MFFTNWIEDPWIKAAIPEQPSSIEHCRALDDPMHKPKQVWP